jgi:hypothetical protein
MEDIWTKKIKEEPINDFGNKKAVLLVSVDEYLKISALAESCAKESFNRFIVMGNGFKQTHEKSCWNEDKWREGLRDILGDYLPVGYHDYELRVVA